MCSESLSSLPSLSVLVGRLVHSSTAGTFDIRGILTGIDLGLAVRVLGEDLQCPNRGAVASVHGLGNAVACPVGAWFGLQKIFQECDDLHVTDDVELLISIPGPPCPIPQPELSESGMPHEAFNASIASLAHDVIVIDADISVQWIIGIRELELPDEHQAGIPQRPDFSAVESLRLEYLVPIHASSHLSKVRCPNII